MKPVRRDPEVLERMRICFELSEAAGHIMWQNLRRRYPEESEEEIRRRWTAWLHHRPGAEHGDGVGRPTTLAKHFGWDEE